MFSDCYEPVINGVVTSIACLVEALERDGHQVSLFVPDHPNQGRSSPGIHRFRSGAFWFHKEERFCLPWPPSTLAAFFQQRFDVVHLHTPFNLGLLGRTCARLRKLPTVFTHHTLWEEYVHYMPLPPKFMRAVAIGICNSFCNGSNRVVAPSAEVRDRLREQGVSNAIDVIPTGIDTNVFAGGFPELAWEELGFAEGSRLFVYVGRVAREKSIDFVLKAFRELHRREPRCRLALVGDGPARAELERQAVDLGLGEIARFLGFRPRTELKHYLAAARGFLFASRTETQGLVLLEAQAAGVPVVGVRASGTSEAVDHERSGVLVDPGDLESFVDAAFKLATEDEVFSGMAQQAREWAESFSSAAMARRMVETYRAAGAGNACHHGV